MPPGKLDAAILLALGLAGGACGDKEEDTGEDTGVHPCLSVEQSDSGPDDTSVTPCLGSEDSGDTGPCLDYAPEDTGDTGEPADTGEPVDTGGSAAHADGEGRAGILARVLARGVLPDDVAKLLGKQKARR